MDQISFESNESGDINPLDLDIKNELLALANEVSQTFNSNELEHSNQTNPNITTDDLTLNNQEKNSNQLYNDDILDNDDLDFKLPEVDWINLEAKLKEAQQEINSQNKRDNFNTDRDEIRRKLAIVSSSSSASSFNDNNQLNENIISDYLRKTNIKNNYLGQNLQICFMNESSSDDLAENETQPECPKQIEKNNREEIVKNRQLPVSFSVFSFDPNNSCDEFLAQHLNLQNETKQALAKVQLEVQQEMDVEKKVVKKASPIADIVGLPTYGVVRLEREHIVDMNIGQLQVIANDLCNQIEKINEDLKDMLIDRDDLYMQQDAILVDIEDITKRIQEYAVAFQNKLTANKDIPKIPVSSSANALIDKTSSKATTTTTNPKNKLLQFSILTNKLFRFNKKT